MEKIGIEMTKNILTHQDIFARKHDKRNYQDREKFPDESNVFIKGGYILN